jgi:23S rRNA pseudouridine1911/1915/1917 synthase
VRLLTADRGDVGRRLDLVIQRHLGNIRGVSRTCIQRWIENGDVTVNGESAGRAAARAALGDVVSVAADLIPSRQPPSIEEGPLEVLYEDEHLLAVNKAAGMVVHPTYKHPAGTLVNAVLGRARSWPPGQRPSVVGRLDKLTSGIVVVAKTAAAHAALQRVLASPQSDKVYLAVVYGLVRPPRGEMAYRLTHREGDRRRTIVSDRGAYCLTQFERVGFVAAPRGGLSLLRCRLVTGRRHQIRVHLAARGWPLVGDPVYGEPRWADIDEPVLAQALHAFPRQALHAWRIVMTHPVTRYRLRLEAPVPNDLQALLAVSGLPTP